jgi:hypothetical protein
MSIKRLKFDLSERSDVIDETIDVTKFSSASSVHNYMLDDPIIDYLKLKNLSASKDSSEHKFFNFLCEKGNKFEENIINKLFRIFKNDFVQICFNQKDIPKISKFKETVREMLKGTPIIYQGSLHDVNDMTYGSPDIIIRSDYINKIIPETLLPEMEKYKAPLLNGKYHYIIIDIKYHILHFKADGKSLLNEGRMKANKGQVYIYNKLLSSVQNYCPKYAYIMGRGYRMKDDFVNSCNKKLGSVASDEKIGSDELLSEKVSRALKWLSYISKNHNDLSFNKQGLMIPELYPNMCNKYDIPYHSIKHKIAKDLGELTMLWSVSYQHRLLGHKNGIFSLKDPKLTCESIGLTSSNKFYNAINDMININRNDGDIISMNSDIISMNSDIISMNSDIISMNSGIINKKKISSKWSDWKLKENDFIIDFEVINNMFDNFENIPYIGAKSYVFMIGIVHMGKYYNFTSESLTIGSEVIMFENMLSTIKKIILEKKIYLKKINFYHWGSIEKYTYNDILKVYPQLKSFGFEIEFRDILDIFISEPIVVKNSLSFTLKSIGNELIRNKLISVDGYTEDCSNGLDAMILAEKIYSENNTKDITCKMSNIINYNKVDCLLTEAILNFLRKMI